MIETLARRWRELLSSATLFAMCCAVFVVPAATAVNGQDSALTDSARAVVAGQVEQSAPARDSDAARQERVLSRTEFRGLTQADARRALLRQHPAVATRPGWLQLPSLSPLAAATPLGPNMLRMDGTLGPDSIVVTSQPVAFRDGAQGLKKIDLGLVTAGSGDLVPRSSPLPLALPASLDQDISVGEGDRRFTIRPEFDTESDAAVEQYAGFYGDVAADTDFVAKPVVGGVETYTILRSPASPELLRLRLGSPADTALRTAGDPDQDGFLLSSGDEDLAAISPVRAWDAQNRPVAVATSVDDDTLVMRVDHRDQDIAYPIVVDPVVVDKCWTWVNTGSGCQVDAWETDPTGTYSNGTAGWAYEGPADRFAPYAGGGYLGTGLYIRNLVNNYFWSGEAGDYFYRAPSGVRIWSALFANLSQDNLGDNTSCLFVGVLESTGAWGTNSPKTYCAQQTLDQSFLWCPRASCTDQSGGTSGNAAIFGAMAQRTGWSSYWMDHMGGIAIAMTEMNWSSLNPYISSPDFPDNWQTDPNRAITIHAGDAGLGIKSVVVSSPENPTWQAIDADTGASANRSYSCTGGTRLACPMDSWIRVKLGDLRQGYSTIRVKVTDLVGKTYTYEHAIGIQYYWASTRYGGANGAVDAHSEVTGVVDAMATASASGRQALWAGLDQASRDYYINDLLPTAKLNRQGFGFNASDATTRSVFNDPTTHGTIAEFGAPMTSGEWASFTDESPSWPVYDGLPDSDVLASTYQVSTDNGADVADSTGNRGCDPSTEVGCPDSGTASTSSVSTPPDPVTDDVTAEAATASSEAAVYAGAASTSGFDRYGARADADAHALSPRSGLYSPFNDSDCTNFVSQVWQLGGNLPMKRGWYIRWEAGPSRGHTRSWTLVRDFVDYMVNERQTSRLIALTISNYNLPASVGIADAIEYDWGEGHGWSHLGVVVKTSTSFDNISQHSTNRRQSLWNLGWVNQTSSTIRANMRARVVHLRAH